MIPGAIDTCAVPSHCPLQLTFVRPTATGVGAFGVDNVVLVLAVQPFASVAVIT